MYFARENQKSLNMLDSDLIIQINSNKNLQEN